jgi:2-dehydro-3-deoxyphosphogalactonate aldolase
MKITEMKSYIVANPDGPGAPSWIFVKLITDEGIEGIGECDYSHGREKGFVALAEDLFEVVVKGADPFQTEKLADDLYAKRHGYRHPEIFSGQVNAAFDMACWDIVGKALGQPVYNLIGGLYHDRLRAYSYLHGWGVSEPLEKLKSAVRKFMDLGFTAFKFDPLPPAHTRPRSISLEQLTFVERVLGAVRDEAGDDIDILMGTHGQFTTASAIRLAQVMEPFRPLWFEEPIPPENVDEMARIARHTTIPIATGERLSTVFEFEQILTRQAAQIIQAHAGLNGVMGLKKIAGMADAHYAQMAPWVWCGPVAAAANLHVMATCRNFLIQEGLGMWDSYDKWLEEPIVWDRGYVIPPDRPGLGVVLDEDYVAAHPYVSQ